MTDAEQDTWVDPPWSDDGALPERVLTREQLVERARANGAEVTARDLIYWETEGVLPRAVKRWHDGATRALYPPWATYFVVTLRRLQRDELPLRAIAEELRRPHHLAIARDAYRPDADPAAGDAVFSDRFFSLALSARMRQIGRIVGKRVARAEVRFFDEDGAEVEDYRHVSLDVVIPMAIGMEMTATVTRVEAGDRDATR